MTHPRLSPEVSLGHILTAISMLCALGVGWGIHSATVERMDSALGAHAELLREHDKAIHLLEVQNHGVATKLEYISKGIDDLKKKP